MGGGAKRHFREHDGKTRGQAEIQGCRRPAKSRLPVVIGQLSPGAVVKTKRGARLDRSVDFRLPGPAASPLEPRILKRHYIV